MTETNKISMKLRALEPEDLEILYTLENDPELWDTSESDAPYSKYILKQYIAEGNTLLSSGELRLVIEIQNNESQRPIVVGFIDITNYTAQSQRAQIGIALLKKYRNKGYGTQALNLIERLTSNKLHIHTLYAYVSIKNIASSKLFNKSGYTPIATLPEWFYYNKSYEDVYFFIKKID